MLAIVLASLLWGTTGTAASFLSSSVSPLATGAATMGIGGLLLLAAGGRESRRALRDPSARPWILVGAIGVVVYPLAFYSAMASAGVAVGNVVSLGSAPVFAALLEVGFERKRLSARWGVATALAVGGIVLLGLGGADRPNGSVETVGILLGLLAGLSYALYTYASRRVLQLGHLPRATVGAVFGAGAPPLLVVLALTGGPLLASANLPIIAYLAVGPMFVAYLLFGSGLRSVGSSTATTVTLLEPVVATLLAVLVVGERLGPAAWGGLLAVLVGVAVLALRPRDGVTPDALADSR